MRFFDARKEVPLAQKLGSEFLREFDKYERPWVFGRTKRQLFMSAGIALSIGLSVGLTYIHFSRVILMIIIGVILVPVTLYGTKKDISLKERYNYLFHIHTYSYQANHNWKGEVDAKEDFKVKKGVTEVIEG